MNSLGPRERGNAAGKVVGLGGEDGVQGALAAFEGGRLSRGGGQRHRAEGALDGRGVVVEGDDAVVHRGLRAQDKKTGGPREVGGLVGWGKGRGTKTRNGEANYFPKRISEDPAILERAGTRKKCKNETMTQQCLLGLGRLKRCACAHHYNDTDWSWKRGSRGVTRTTLHQALLEIPVPAWMGVLYWPGAIYVPGKENHDHQLPINRGQNIHLCAGGSWKAWCHRYT